MITVARTIQTATDDFIVDNLRTHINLQRSILPILRCEFRLTKRNCHSTLVDLEKQFNEDYRQNEEHPYKNNVSRSIKLEERRFWLNRCNVYVGVAFLFLLFMSSVFTIEVLKNYNMLY
mgnify:CR=1 FL=1